ncbi:MAG: HAD family hydrolase [Candidatus Izemoplasmatales bacterium]
MKITMIENYLFDLDGTLLPLDEDVFLQKYLGLLSKKFIELGYDSKVMIDRLWQGTKAMVNNNGLYSNEEVFWNIFHPEIEGRQALKIKLENFYKNEFSHVFDSTSPNPFSKKIIENLKAKGKRVFLLTNPIFPLVATQRRVEWAGLNIDDFELVTTYENSAYAKPNIKYYESVLNHYNLDTKYSIMVGNDAYEDMIVRELGVKVYLVKDCLKNSRNLDIHNFDQGTLEDFYIKYID